MTKIIKSAADYEVALGEIERLIDLDPKAKTAEAEQLELLTLLVENYEAKAFPISLPDPVDAILFQMEQHSLTPRSLIPYIGSRSKVSEVLSRKRSLTLSMIRALHDGLGIPARALIQESLKKEHNLEHEEEPDWSCFPIKEMVARGWVEDSLLSVKAFFSQLSVPAQNAILLRKTKHIRSARSMDTFALTAWVAQIITKANKIPKLGHYRKGSVNLDFMRELTKCSSLENGPAAARVFLAKHGIPLIIEPHLPSTYLDGAAILIFPEKPIIGMTIRHDRLDNFWFTLMHELAHVALHSDQENTEFIDDLDIEAKEDPKENEADALAGEALIPKSVWSTSAASRIPSPEAAQSLAKKLGIHPAVAAGRMRHERKAFRLLNNLIGHREVRKQFPDIKWLD
jgi:HTH-type transcriptional regulator / antitoxin HigA